MAKQVESWEDVTDEEIEVIMGKLFQLKAEITPVDCDGDPVVELVFIDRRKYGPMHYFRVPYEEQDKAGHEAGLLSNLKLAIDAYDTFLRIESRKFEWCTEWPKENGLFWFYGWCFKHDRDEDKKPELCLVDVHETGVKGKFMYVTWGHFLYAAEGATGMWRKAELPPVPTGDKAKDMLTHAVEKVIDSQSGSER